MLLFRLNACPQVGEAIYSQKNSTKAIIQECFKDVGDDRISRVGR